MSFPSLNLSLIEMESATMLSSEASSVSASSSLLIFYRIAKGETLLIPIAAINRDKTIWGDDAHEFRPERWETVPEEANRIPGVWGNVLTFLGGPRACIGYRFSLV
ncbi:hypothetical protein H0H93_003423, partial [Arthromyces matolae]